MNELETPWVAIHDFLAEVGRARTLDELVGSAASLLRRLVPYEFGQAVSLGPLHCISRLRCIDLPDRFAASYPAHFAGQVERFRRTRQLDDPRLFYTTDKPFRRTAFGADWVRPLGLRYSTGIAIDAPAGQALALIILYRTRCSMGFTERERRILGLIAPHLTNLALCLSQAGRPAAPPRPVEEHVDCLEQLSPREKEVVIALCRGEATTEVSSRLLIRPSTVYRHINNIFDKLGVSTRQALIAKVLRTG